MIGTETVGLFAGAVALGAVHGVEPGHGWPVAASYALDQTNKWLYGFAASFILGLGHLISSIAMVAVFFYAKSYFDLTRVNEPITLIEGLNVAGIVDLRIGGPVSLVAGILLIVLGIREYYGGGHSHDHIGHSRDRGDRSQDHGSHSADHGDHSHAHGDHSHAHGDHLRDPSDHDHSGGGLLSRVLTFVPFVGGHSHGDPEEAADRGLWGIAWFAFLLGFAHEEEFEIIALCAGSKYCLELMSAYAITVIVGIVGLTMLLIAGYKHYEQEVEKYTPYLPVFSAVVLILMGVGFVTGSF
jgi:ABC-type nickel/cobalt efflux system permease component RcnA